jgi:hypothetical protein
LGREAKARWFFYSIKKEGNFRIFQARDHAIDEFAYREDPKLVRAFDAQ